MELETYLTMPSIPIVPIVLASSLGALYYVDMQYKAQMDATVVDELEHEKSLAMKKKIKYGLMGSSVGLVLLMVYNMFTKSKAKSSFENRVAYAANSLRSSMNLQEGGGSSAEPYMSPPTDDFSARVSQAAAELRRQISSSADLSSNEPMASSDLAAKASAEISQFISENS